MKTSKIEPIIYPESSIDDTTACVLQQLICMVPGKHIHTKDLRMLVDTTMQRMQESLSKVKLCSHKTFNIYQSDLYAQFLYLLSNTIWNTLGDREYASRVFCLNKALNGINCMYDTKLPTKFLFIHTVGTVLGKAKYGEYLVVCQNVTVGTHRECRPILGDGIYIGPYSSIVGDCRVGNWTTLSIRSELFNRSTSQNSVVVGLGDNALIKTAKRNIIAENFFDI